MLSQSSLDLQKPVSKSVFIKKIIAAFRPKTLTAALVPCLAGSALYYGLHQSIDFQVLCFALISSFCIQIGTNLVNDSVDFKKGADTSERIGPERITASGILSAKTVMLIAGFFFLLAVLFGLPLVFKGGLPIIILGLISVFMGYSYTAGPFPLAYLGLGDLFVVLFFGFVAVGGIYFLNGSSIDVNVLVLGAQIGLHAAVLIAINNLRDIEGDQKVSKKTLAVRLGIQKSRFLIGGYIFVPFILSVFWIHAGHPLCFVLPLLSLPLGIKIIRDVYTTLPSPIYNQFLARSAGLHLAFGLLTSIGFIL